MDLPGPIRKASVGGPYLELEFPEFFRVDALEESGNWIEWGAYFSEAVNPQPDGSYVLASHGSPFYIRNIADHGEFFVHLDGDGMGQIFFYRIVPLPSPRPKEDTAGVSR